MLYYSIEFIDFLENLKLSQKFYYFESKILIQPFILQKGKFSFEKHLFYYKMD